ncbi:MAG: hypothetical protein QM778_08550 [Myxococcales bacterium]
MLNDSLLERALRWLLGHIGEAQVLSARRQFEEATGPILEGAPDYESRIAHFFEQYLCGAAQGERAPLGRFAEQAPELSQEDRTQLAGWLRSHRSLFAFEGWEPESRLGRVRDLWLGGTYRVCGRPEDRQLAQGDRFDGRLIAVSGSLWLSPGRVFHPRAAHGAIDELLQGIGEGRSDTAGFLNGLLRMRARYYQFESIRAEHVYRLDALPEPAFAAPWASPARRR